MNSLRTTIARTSSRVAHKIQKRQMGAGAAQPQWTGIDKVIRDRFPEDYQVAGLIIGGYATLFTLVSLKPSKAKEEPVVVSKPAADVVGAIPSVEDESFADFIENEGNLQKWIDSAE
mmetsp:Transcript_13048/g.24517  ORF Transcript_13048/g.24517 Transcript_13048/m.24517 type:complete len:117 (-) Transcript_13048:186-536(-)|eukprot:CAMPEP_0176488706 /NCGR_PEP_ID=MMETSP0200_2-20121128/6863_1 /TAXON_ID=947934 /ORGANISM="Chaetoceros sp., Strain GSL56" /LENGTH=116 /DNA_ID=CAMNT_0017885729 /DNA_START=69 /DNA_END=419 /DNA_ORIENTATION=+